MTWKISVTRFRPATFTVLWDASANWNTMSRPSVLERASRAARMSRKPGLSAGDDEAIDQIVKCLLTSDAREG